MVEFRYEIRETSLNQQLASGETKHIFLGRDMKPVKLPPKYYPFFGIVK
jgi:acyl-CoA thioesterase FadM